MFFYVDESGHTGSNLFDPDQPLLFYGALSSRLNVDVLAKSLLKRARQKAGVKRLHANELGNSGLSRIAEELIRAQKRFSLRFDFYRVNKKDHAAICFFDQIFDQGMNPAVPWSAYWTPLRYMLLLRVSTLFDEELLRAAWAARITPIDKKAEEILREVCNELLGRISELPDERTQEIVTDALNWAITNTSEIHYNVRKKSDAISVMPNAIGFQHVLIGIALRVRQSGRKDISVVVDRQSQFNKAQARTNDWYGRLSGANQPLGPGLPTLDLRGMPNTKISFSSGFDSAGLELVDVYLWIFKRLFEEKDVTPDLYPLIKKQLPVGHTDEISLSAIVRRWEPVFRSMEATELTEEQLMEGRKLMEADEMKRRVHLAG